MDGPKVKKKFIQIMDFQKLHSPSIFIIQNNEEWDNEFSWVVSEPIFEFGETEYQFNHSIQSLLPLVTRHLPENCELESHKMC
jgi:hypothetical protein